MKILYISQYYPPEVCAPAARVSELAQHWVKMGHEVTVLTGFPNHPNGIVPPEYRSRLRRGFCHDDQNGVKVLRSWLLARPNRKPLERMANYTSFCISAAIAGTFAAPPDVVIATSPQLLVGLSGWWTAAVKRLPLIFEVRDLWPESVVATGQGRRDSLLYKGLSAIANFLYQRSAHIVVVTAAFRNVLISDWRVADAKISVINNGVETELFVPHPRQEARSAWNDEITVTPQDFLVAYIGTMGNAHGVGTILEAAEMLRTREPRVQFLFAGDGAEREHMIVAARARGLTNLHFLPQQPRDRVPSLISAADVCLVPLRKSEVFRTVIPTKMLEFMSCSRPVILGVEGQAQEIIETSGAGVCVEPENSSELAEAILKLVADPKSCKAMGEAGRNHIVTNLSRQRTAKEYLCVLEKVVRDKNAPRCAQGRENQKSEAHQ